MTPPPAPLHPPPYFAITGYLHFAPLSTMLPACSEVIVLLIVAGYVYWYQRRDRANRARLDHDIECQQQQVGVAASPPMVVVMLSSGDARKFNIEEYVICLRSFEEGEECCVLKTCNHGYRESCIMEWASRDQHCPLCRGSIQAGRAAHVTPTLADS
ncbi:RING-H2 finger protein ATL79-like [Eucalyptus grandis]|uniref:RING-H2 finger protein ATL79-like n=1 Tax=Eucalyptus grandis TaxID=71139 RepID=UPI0008A0BCDB|nr:RING-H2 finger protein ATL79-like [Eucalyptus grandis]